MIQLRDYQQKLSKDACKILERSRFVYLALEVRTGKTLTSLNIANMIGASHVLFVTKKKAIGSIISDYKKLNPFMELEVINYESLHKVESNNFRVVILDEAHCIGSFPKPSNRARAVRDVLYNNDCKVIFLSGTPTPESFSQMYHQMWVLGDHSPFSGYQNFYKWAKDYVDIKQKKINSLFVNDYSRGIELKINSAVAPFMINFTQKEAGFESNVEEEVILLDMPEAIRKISENLIASRVIEGKNEVILADTGAKLMQKLHQIYSGTIMFESGSYMVLDPFKAQEIHNRFKDNRIAIFYKFKAELESIISVFGDSVTTGLEAFQNGEVKNFAVQIVSGREGINLSAADYIVFYNIDFSATSYWQGRDRMTTKERAFNKIYWVFTKGGIEEKVYKLVNKKKNYTLSHFKKNYGVDK